MVFRSLAFARLAAARFGGPASLAPGSCVPSFVAGGVPPLSAAVRWGVVLGGAAASWRPGLVLSGCDCDFLASSESLAHSAGLAAWVRRSACAGPAPLVVCFWVLPSGLSFVASVASVRPSGGEGVAC